MLFYLAVVIILSLFLSALTTPLFYELLITNVDNFPWPYSRVFDRVVMLWLAVLIYKFRKQISFSEITKRLKSVPWKKPVFFGILISLGISTLLLPFVVASGELEWAIKDFSFYLKAVPKVVAAAFLVGILEEVFFRGLILNTLTTKLSKFSSVILVSFFYAGVHFISPSKSWLYPGYSWNIGFSYLSELFSIIFIPQNLAPFCGLLLIGITLGTTAILTSNLWLCIGLHAGWIFAAKGLLYFTKIAPTLDQFVNGLARRYFVVSLPLAWISIAVIFSIVLILRKHFKSEPTK
ncbi:MAG: CPBP family intramembrane glutamic endopeptidase [bacterium]|nr:CPBP family intramembrane glutamic endopeptidase [bacterium]